LAISLSNLDKKISSLLMFLIISITASFTMLYITNDSYSVESQNDTSDNIFNIITISDVGCSMRAQENIKNIEKLDPELFLVAGDLSYKKTPDCWFNMTKSPDSKTKIAIGNHDDYEEEGSKGEILNKSYMDHYGLNKSYYSFDYQNVHVLVLDTQLELSVDTLESTAIINETSTETIEKDLVEDDKKEKKDDNKNTKDKKKEEPLLERFPLVEIDDLLKQKSIDVEEIPQLDKLIESNAKVPSLNIDEEQYRFVLDDLKKTSENKDIDWIIVMLHKPLYSSISKQLEEYIIRDKYHDIFDKYNVDLVIQGHNHIYSRTLPLSLNESDIAQPIIDQSTSNNNNNNNNNNTVFTNPNGTIFLVVGTGGQDLHRITEKPHYVASQYNEGFGFVDIKIDGKQLDGTFFDISLNCKMEITEKKKKEIIDLESCLPSSSIGNNNNLKIKDRFTIIK
jgi:Calcineurin-like phosphoesterase